VSPTQLFAVAVIGLIVNAVIAYLTLLQTRATHTQINSRMDELLRTTRENERAKGVVEGKAYRAVSEAEQAKGNLEGHREEKAGM